MGDAALGVITSFHYSAAHESPENEAFMKAFAEANGRSAAELHGRGRIRRHGGDLRGAQEERRKIDGDKLVAALKGTKWTSPRGPITIDPQTRDIVQTVYVRKVEKIGNEPYNVEFDKFPDQKDPGK